MKYIELTAIGIEIIGVAIIAGGTLILLMRALYFLKTRRSHFIDLRRQIGQVILLGLEVLVAGDIISTVVTKPNLEQVSILGLIVLIRTFLSFSLQVELEGKFPWQHNK